MESVLAFSPINHVTAADDPASPWTVPVLIAGGGPVGTALALELALLGHRALLVERADRIPEQHPRGGNNTMRTVEHYRRWGIATRLRQAAIRIATAGDAALIPSAGDKILFSTAIFGAPLGTFAFDWGRTAAQHRAIAAEPSVSVNQPKALAILRERAIGLGATILTGWELVSTEQSDEQVTSVIREVTTGVERVVHSNYLAGCDGANGVVRKSVGIVRDRVGEPDHFATMCIVRLTGRRNSDIFASLRYRMEGFQVVANGQVVSNASTVDDTRWRFTLSDLADGRAASHDDVARAAAALFGADIGFEVDTVSSYRIQLSIAQRYRAGRVFIAGDAAHLFPPAGGHNQNLGISDAVNLGWKLAAVLEGWGGEVLLESYDQERRPTAWRVANSSWTNYHAMSEARAIMFQSDVATGDDDAAVAARRALGERIYRHTYRQWKTHGVVLDIRYDASPVIAAEPGAAPAWESTEYLPLARPGHRAPHAWLGADAATSDDALYDHLGPGYTLLQFADDGATHAQADVLRITAAALAIPLTLLPVPDAAVAALYAAPLVLVRPDQQVAWRGASVPDAVALWQTLAGLRPASASAPVR